MIENVNASKMPSTGEFVTYPKYIGVASINVLAINPNNDKLRKFGWNLPDDAEEPSYLIEKKDENGKITVTSKVRLLAQIQDLDEKPIVMLDFFCRPDILVNKDGTKCKIIDQYGRTAWATKDELKNHKIPVYSDGREASISYPYKPCHKGEAELVTFLYKYLNITPLQSFDKVSNSWVLSKNPGKLTIDNWNSICSGDISEIAGYLALQPENRVKVILGITSTEDNKSYQAFMNDMYISNGARVDMQTGEYATARKYIDKYFAAFPNSSVSYSATVVKEWKPVATTITEQVNVTTPLFDENGNFTGEPTDDLPF